MWMYGSWWDFTIVKDEYECMGIDNFNIWIWMYGSWWYLTVIKSEYECMGVGETVVICEYECMVVGEIWQLLMVNINVWELVWFDSCYMWIWMYGSWWDLTVVKGEYEWDFTVVKGEYECMGVGEISQLL